MNPRIIHIRALCALSCLFAQIVVFAAPIAADDSERIVRMDGKAVYIPEIKLTNKVNPVATYLYIGSWIQKAKKDNIQKSLCEIDSANNSILVKSSESLLENSRTRLLTRGKAGSFLDRILWERRQATHIAFNVISDKRQPAVMEIAAESDVVLFHNGKLAGSAPAGSVLAAEGTGYLPVMLEKGANIINIKQYSDGRPRLQMSVRLDHSHDLEAAWQPQGGLLKKLIIMQRGRAGAPILEWSQQLGNFSVSLEVRDVATNTTILQRDAARQGRISDDENDNLPPGIYEAVYRFKDESASEFFVIGDSRELFAKLQNDLSKHNIDPSTKPNIEAQQRRAQILLAEKNYNIFDREWQEKLAYTLGCLASINHKLGAGEPGMIKDQAGLQIKGFVSKLDGSAQFYRLFVPASITGSGGLQAAGPGAERLATSVPSFQNGRDFVASGGLETAPPSVPMPLLVIIPTRIADRERPFIEGPVMANQREALLWAKYAQQYGFAVLWPGYRSVPEGYSYESMRIDEAIQAVARDYAIDKSRISVFGSCSAGYNAGRLISEYPNRFAAIVYDRAVFNLKATDADSSPSAKAWRETIDPVRHVLENRNLKIFVMHDDTKPPGHGEMELTTQFLEQAKTVRNDVVSYVTDQPMGVTRMDMVFDWLASCRNAHPDDIRFNIAAQAGYAGPISEIFTTPILIVKGTHATGRALQDISATSKSIRDAYGMYFHDAECAVKNDVDVTQEDIDNHSLILIGNPQSNHILEQ